MDNYVGLKSAIAAAVYPNNNNEITGTGLQNVLLKTADTAAQYDRANTAGMGASFGVRRLMTHQNVISNSYINASGAWVSLGGNNTKIFSVSAGDVLYCVGGQTSSYSAWAFFVSSPTYGSAPDVFCAYTDATSNYFAAPSDGFVAVSGYQLNAKAYKLTTEDLTTDFFNNSLCFNELSPVRTYNGYYINSDGNWVSQGAQQAQVYIVHAGDKILAGGQPQSAYAAWAFFTDMPTTSTAPTSFMPYYNEFSSYFTASADGYVVVTGLSTFEKANALSCKVLTNVTNTRLEFEKLLNYEQLLTNSIKNYYINADGVMVPQNGQEVIYAPVSVGDVIILKGTGNQYYSGWAFYSNEPTAGAMPDSFRRYRVDDLSRYFTAQKDGYISVSGMDGKLGIYKKKTTFNILNPYDGKVCLYIGDSISTQDLYHWKGYLENNYDLKYARDITGELAPANGGISVRPRSDDDTAPIDEKSIWYRCADNRMSIYDFDMISLFGGTNDMTHQDLVIGTINDVAYVDDAATITGDSNITDVMPDPLTFASALKGCILMLKRDFPFAQIVLPTVMPCTASSYGNWIDSVTGLKASEAIAELQLRIAEYYAITAIPLYWDMRTTENAAYNWADQWGVHPNHQGARRIQSIFAQTLCLR